MPANGPIIDVWENTGGSSVIMMHAFPALAGRARIPRVPLAVSTTTLWYAFVEGTNAHVQRFLPSASAQRAATIVGEFLMPPDGDQFTAEALRDSLLISPSLSRNRAH